MVGNTNNGLPAEEVQKKLKYRRFTEPEFYRPLAQLHDEVEYLCNRNLVRTLGWTLTTVGITHLFTAFTTRIPDYGPFQGDQLSRLYLNIAAGFLFVGIILLVVHLLLPNKVRKSKENRIRTYIDREFTGDNLTQLKVDSDGSHTQELKNAAS